MVLPRLSRQQLRRWQQLHHRKGRQKQQCFLVEGPTLVEEALDSQWPVLQIGVQQDVLSKFATLLHRAQQRQIPVFQLLPWQMQRVSATQTPSGIIAVIAKRAIPFDLESSFLVLDQIADPGNMGTILRTADWFGVRNIVLRTGSVDPFNPKVVRASMGAIFRLALQEVQDPLSLLRSETPSPTILALTPDSGAEPLSEVFLTSRWALIVGNEARGVDPELLRQVEYRVRIPSRQPKADSLNVAMATAIALYEFCARTEGIVGQRSRTQRSRNLAV